MNLFIEGQLFNVFRNKDFKQKDTGDVKVGKWKLQFMVDRDMGDGRGTQKVFEDVSIPDTLYDRYKDMVNKNVKLEVGTMSMNNKVIFFGIDKSIKK